MADNNDNTNISIVLKEHCPEGLPEMGKHWVVEEGKSVETLKAALKEGEVLLKLLEASVDPYMRGRMKAIPSYFPFFKAGEAGSGGQVCEVVASKNEKFQVGDAVSGFGPWSSYWVSDGSGLFAIPKNNTLPLSFFVGICGMPGATAYFGFHEICEPKEGETVVVSGAAGAVGSVVTQLAKLQGCRVVAIAGSEEKCEFLKTLGADVTINYKSTENMREAIKEAASDGVDCYFDNVGGYIKDAVISNTNQRARISCCGAISSYNQLEASSGQNNEWLIITRQLKLEGFIVSRWSDRWPEWIQKATTLLLEKKLQYKETTVDGLPNLIEAFNQMMNGVNIGKMVVHVANPSN